MADIYTTNFTHTFAGDEVLSEMFYQPEVGGGDIFDSFYRYENVPRGKKQIYVPNKIRKITKVYTTCERATPTATATIDDIEISVTSVKADINECAWAIEDTALSIFLKKGKDRPDLAGTEFVNIINKQYRKGIQSDISRIQWFADSSVTNVDWKHFDGWVTLLYSNSATLGGAYNLQSLGYENTSGVMNVDGALNAFNHYFDNIPDEMLSYDPSQIRFMVSPKVYYNYQKTLSSTSIDAGWSRVQDGKTQLYFQGMLVQKMDDWGVNLADPDNPHYSTIGDNLIVITVEKNLVVGSDIKDPTSEFMMWYEKKDRQNYWNGNWRQGAQIIHHELFVMYT